MLTFLVHIDSVKATIVTVAVAPLANSIFTTYHRKQKLKKLNSSHVALISTW